MVRYDQRGTGNNPDTLPDGYRMQDMAAELHQALREAGIRRYCVTGHALGALIGLQLALDHPDAVSGLVLVNGWLTLNDHTRRCFQVRERLLQAGGAEAVERSRCFFTRRTGWRQTHREWKPKKRWLWRIFRGNQSAASPQRPESGGFQRPRRADPVPDADHLLAG